MNITPTKSNDFVDKAFMAEKYQLTPDQWIDYKILKDEYNSHSSINEYTSF